jgi:hypothetical protein
MLSYYLCTFFVVLRQIKPCVFRFFEYSFNIPFLHTVLSLANDILYRHPPIKNLKTKFLYRQSDDSKLEETKKSVTLHTSREENSAQKTI